MRITAEIALRGVARTLRERIGPALDDAFASEATRLAELVVLIVANGTDNEAALRVWENAGIRALFVKARTIVLSDPLLSADLAEAGASSDPGLLISQLDAETGRLRSLLVRLHAAVDDQPGTAERDMNREIWQLLRDVETARAPRS